MLLLVPSKKADEEGLDPMSTLPKQILVVLPSDACLVANVVVPDAAITTTSGINDLVEPSDSHPSSPYSTHRQSSADPPRLGRDHLGILQPAGPGDIGYNRSASKHPHPSTQLYHGAEEALSRARRHSHTGLMDAEQHQAFESHSHTRSRSRSRQSFSHAGPYQHQPIRTPRSLRSAFRRARKEQSPLLTSAGFGVDYDPLGLATDEGDDSLWKRRSTRSSHDDQHHGAFGVLDWEMKKNQAASTMDDRTHASERIQSRRMGPDQNFQLHSEEHSEAIDLDTDDDDDHQIASAAVIAAGSTFGPKRTRSCESIDIETVTDDEVEMEEAPKAESKAMGSKDSPQVERHHDKEKREDNTEQDMEESDLHPTDMDVILGIDPDMELVMPQFDDVYLEDLKNDTLPSGSSADSALSPTSSHSSSTTITCVSTLPSPTSRSLTPIVSPDRDPQQPRPPESPPTSPRTLAARNEAQPSGGTLQGSSPESGEKDLSTIHRDIDNLRRHRDSLNDSNGMSIGSNSLKGTSPASSAGSQGPPCSSLSKSSTPTTTEKRGPHPQAAHIYFKPTHHTQPSHPDNHPHQNVMIIQSNQWTMDKGQQQGIRNLAPTHNPILRNGNDGNHIFKIHEASPTPPPPPPPVLDKSAIMTTNNISLATANMNVLTPQEVQEDYYQKRTMQRLQHQRQRRKSTTPSSSMIPTHRGSISSSVGSRIGASSPSMSVRNGYLSSSSSSSVDVHPLDKTKPVVPAIGASALPASYYIPPSAFRTEAAVAAEKAAERKLKEEEEWRDSFLVFPSPTLS